jgi:hypothetical protein
MNTETPKEVVKFSKPSLTKRTIRKVLLTIKTVIKTITLLKLLKGTFNMLRIIYYQQDASKIASIYIKADSYQQNYIIKEILEKNTNPFSIIGMQKITSSQSDIKKSFIKASLKYHPDKNKHSDGSKMRKINNAMEFLRLKESADVVKISNSIPKIVKVVLAMTLRDYDIYTKQHKNQARPPPKNLTISR